MINRTLFIVDLQRDFCKNGTLEIPTADYIVPKINQLLPKYTSILHQKIGIQPSQFIFKNGQYMQLKILKEQNSILN